jgi:hypothetical protein
MLPGFEKAFFKVSQTLATWPSVQSDLEVGESYRAYVE